MKTIIRYLLITLAAVLSLLLIWFCLVFDFRGEKILIPYDYRGGFGIYYNVKEGDEMRTDGFLGRIILKIPPSGVLVVKHGTFLQRKRPLVNRRFYLYDPATGKIIGRLKRSSSDISKRTYKDIEVYSWMQFSSLSVYGNEFKGITQESFSVQIKGVPRKRGAYYGRPNLRETLRQRKKVYEK
jgi:hypothetical protein